MSLRPTALVLALTVCAPVSAASFTITGVVRNEAGAGLPNVDLDFVDDCTGQNAFLVNDKTAADGSYSIVVNEGTYDIRYTPPSGSTVAATERTGYVVAASASLGTTTLHPGRLVSGTVRNASSTPVAGVDLKFVDVVTGKKVWITKDLTSSTGTYSVRVVPGTYDVEYRPPATTTYATTRRRGLVVGSSDVSGLVDTLLVGFNVSGTVRSAAGADVQNVDLNFYDDCTGEKIPTANDNTDVQGKYSVYVPAGTYSIHYGPPACRSLAAERLPDQKIDRNVGLNQVTLQPGLPVGGRVLDETGAPLAAAKLKFYDAASGTRHAAVNDDSDAAGWFSILMPAGTWDINVEPPSSRDLLVTRVDGVAVTGPTEIGDVGLQAGEPVTGRVTDTGGTPVRNVNVNAVDSATRARIRLAHDSTAADGTFRVVLPPGTFDIQYAPPACSGLAPGDQRNVPVTGPTALPTMVLVAGVHAMGRVVDDAMPQSNNVAGVDLDFFRVSDVSKAYTPGDTTSSAGDYDVVVQPDAYDIDYVPPRASALRPTRVAGQNLFVDTTFPDVVLHRGVLLSGTVVAQASGLPVASASVEAFAPGAASPLWTPHNGTAADGTYSLAVDPGTWDLLTTPPPGSGLAPRWRRGVAATVDTVLPATELLPLTVPTVSSVAPGTGPTSGGTPVTIGGSGFQPDAAVRFGGIAARAVTVVSETQISATTPAHPGGPVAVEVVNPGDQAGALASGYTFVEPAVPVRITLSKSGTDVVLTWTATGQASYTVFRSSTPNGFGAGSALGTTPGLSWTDAGEAANGALRFYNVD